MRWVWDATRRFPKRPHYELSELNDECEHLIEALLCQRHGAIRYPVTTEDLAVLIEQEAQDLDLYADLAAEGTGVEGVTYFDPGKRPRVAVSADLTNDDRRQNRLRTTLTHEFGHVHFHNFLWTLEAPSHELFEAATLSPRAARCHRDSIIDTRVTDWMEWQAAFACGALLMPARAVRTLVPSAILRRPESSTSSAGTTLIAQVQERFVVSADAARVRLSKLGYLMGDSAEVSLLR
jgi:Zn-dependent peptidase ImmA (M78 family)